MMMLSPLKIVFLVILSCALAVPGPAFADGAAVAVLLSREIAPYVAMVEGVEEQFADLAVQRFFLDPKGEPYSLAGAEATLNPARYRALVAVGPEALAYLLPRVESVPLIYGMVLNPAEILGRSGNAPCGVTLNLPFVAQLSSIRQHFAGLARLGILYDPVNNQGWFDAASIEAAALDVELLPLQVSKQGGRLEIVGDLNRPDAILFIPDRSIISRAVIQHVIKEAVRHRVPVVGYNQFFHDSGAALSFVIDYRAIGRQVAAQVRSQLEGEGCQGMVAPLFESRVNADAWRVLGLSPLGNAADKRGEGQR